MIHDVQDAPLVVMNNFGGEEHLKLATVLFQNLFPAINVHTTSLKICKVTLPTSACTRLGAISIIFNILSREPAVARWTESASSRPTNTNGRDKQPNLSENALRLPQKRGKCPSGERSSRTSNGADL